MSTLSSKYTTDKILSLGRQGVLSVEDLRKGFGSGRRRLEVLKGINLKVDQGELVSMMGPSGCGKSTLLNIIGGLLEADSGKITLQSFNYGTKSPNRVVDVRRNGVGWIFQDFHLVDRLTALDNVAFSLELSGMSSSEAEERAKAALERVGLGDRMDFIPDQLSGGQQQRVAVARAISGSRPLILADEPTGNLDVKSGQEIIHLFQDLCKNDGISVLMVTHDPLLASMADRMLLLKDGVTAASDIRSAWGIEEVKS
ncbi:MAG: ABC transporter ATP-binding protein [Candidatus Thermoplasmatota archaeon]|nr:ABC transporter ATP-binding protein [Candidatus Thermoplasmatota archaeon]